MGWRDAPLVEQEEKIPEWKKAPLVEEETKKPSPKDARLTADIGTLLGPDNEQRERVIGQTQGRESSQNQAIGLGLQAGTLRNWNDEIGGAAAASNLPVWVPPAISAPVGGLLLAAGDKGATKRYGEASQRLRGYYEGTQEAHPNTTLASEIVGGAAGPVGSGVVGNLGIAAAEGAIAGAGAGEDANSRGMGAATGGAIGAGTAGVFEIGRRALQPIYGAGKRLLMGPERAALDDVSGALRKDLDRMNPAQRAQFDADRAFKARSGQPEMVADLGGENTRSLLRSTANVSPEAKGIYQDALNGRYQGQAERFGGWWGRLTGHPDAVIRQQGLEEAARRANGPRYRAAYSAGEVMPMTDELTNLTQSQHVGQAIRGAVEESSNQAALRGERSTLRNPFVQAEDGTLHLPPGQTPTLEFWDQVQRNLRSKAESFPRGSQDRATVNQLRQRLNQHLDAAVPEFGNARRGAAAFFGQEDALEAGRTFLNHPRASSTEARQALGRMSHPERELFRDGLSEDVSNMVRAMPPGQDLGKFLQSQEIQSRLNVGLGPERAADLQNYLRVERAQTLVKNALGNSTTAAQLLGAGAVGAAVGYTQGGDVSSMAGGGTLAAGALALLRGGNQRLNANAANHIAELLMSQDPADMQRLARAVRDNPAIGNAVNGLITRGSAMFGQQGGKYMGSQ